MCKPMSTGGAPMPHGPEVSLEALHMTAHHADQRCRAYRVYLSSEITQVGYSTSAHRAWCTGAQVGIRTRDTLVGVLT